VGVVIYIKGGEVDKPPSRRRAEMKGKLIWSIFWVLVGVFVIVVCTMFVPPLSRLVFSSENPIVNRFVLLPAWVVFIGLGVTLLVLTVKTKVGGMLKKFLLLTGASIVGLPIFAILHNVIIVSGILNKVGSSLFNPDEPLFWFMAYIVCPIGFLVGVVGSIVLAIKTKPSVPAGTS
jgi:hypothetical protein